MTVSSVLLLALTFISSATAACYDDWKTLLDDVEASDGEETFVVCIGTDLKPYGIESGGEIFTDIWIYESNIRILCGETGSSTNMCTFSGGRSHLYIPDDDITGTYVSGFTFKNANETSVMTYGTSDSTATFHDCHWEGNTGDEGAALNVWHTYDARGQAQSVLIDDCSFIDNAAADGTVLVEGGKVTIKNSQFRNNKGGWPVELQLDSTLSLHNTCFQDNPGPVFIYPGSTVVELDENYAYNNNEDGYECEGAYNDNTDECTVFSASQCLADEVSSVQSASASNEVAPFRLTVLVLVGSILLNIV